MLYIWLSGLQNNQKTSFRVVYSSWNGSIGKSKVTYIGIINVKKLKSYKYVYYIWLWDSHDNQKTNSMVFYRTEHGKL